jgi:hypothetical protein
MESYLDVVLEIYDGASCSWKRFLFVCPYWYLDFMGRNIWLAGRLLGFW